MADHWITFFIAREKYCLEVTAVKEVMCYREPVPVPGTADEVMGILNVRGHMVTVLSGESLLQIQERVPNSEGHVILLELDAGLFGIVVEDVGEIIQFDRRDICRDFHTASVAGGPVMGTVNYESQLVIVLDAEESCKELINAELEI